MAATNGDQASAAAAAGELVSKPPPHITIPPKNTKDAIAKTAEFVARRGDRDADALTKRVREAGNATMSFVLPDDQYNPYYLWYVQQLREGKGPAKAAEVVDSKPKGPPEPLPFRFSARMPNISAKDLEVLKLTALYTARVGENWFKELRNRESGNSAFDFLRANHSFFPFFRALIEQYKVLLEEEQTVEARIGELQSNIKNRFHILDRAKGRAEYDQHIAQQKEKDDKKAENDKKEWSSIDWMDFSVIATVLFDEGDDAAELPPPTILSDLQSASLEQKAAVSLSARRIEEAMPDEMFYYNAIPTPSMPAASGYPGMVPMAPLAPPVQPAYQLPATVPADYRTQAQNQREQEEARIAREREAEQLRAAQVQAAARAAPSSMRIRTDYVPRGKKANMQMVQCPNCMQQFPSDEIQEHMRIELLDPRWKEQRAKTDARYSTVINPTDAANNLKRFASQRDDIYDGVTGVPITEEEAARRKKAATSYDGQPDPAKDAVRVQQMQNMNVQEQLRRIQERHGHGQ
ncbi:hypothetical protein P280DRAFT_497661 [Massarina eburnea CBS 473.64]|uniref:SURP motif domain-containing protein n=1 Tax=Massarina eburnea CBS 473.64 TaxID=1395130 RepID=A0A6A6S2F3_9PLEO|nr:hypothetical protein P280DRAFT_497661 [Massarina eburnea CBS 473.64]